MDKTIPSGNVFRIVDGKYVHNNEEISKEEFYRRKAEADSAMREMRGLPSSSVRGKEPSFEERRAKAFQDLEGMKKGGAVKKTKISTHQKSKKSPNW